MFKNTTMTYAESEMQETWQLAQQHAFCMAPDEIRENIDNCVTWWSIATCMELAQQLRA